MFQDSSRQALRAQFFNAYQKHVNQQKLTPLETQIVAVILEHPEYHALLADESHYIDKNFALDEGFNNPFLHMSAHLGLREQLNTNRPKGIVKIFKELLKKHQGNAHEAEHQILPLMLETICEAQLSQTLPDEEAYLKKIRKLVKR